MLGRNFVGLFMAVFAGVSMASGAADAQTAPRLGYIDSQRILAEAPGTSDAQVAFEADMEAYRAELATLQTELETLQDNFDRQQATLSAAIREQRQQEMQQKFVAYQTRSTELEEVAQQRQAELVGPIMEKITQVIEGIRIEGNYAMIFDASVGVLIAVDPRLDLTDQVLQRLQAATTAP